MFIISLNPLDIEDVEAIHSHSANVGVSVSHSAFSGTQLVGGHIPTQGEGWIGVGGHTGKRDTGATPPSGWFKISRGNTRLPAQTTPL